MIDAPLPPCPPSSGIRFMRATSAADDENGDDVPVDPEHHCFSAYPTLVDPTIDCAVCQSDSVCVRPVPEEGILRIRYSPTPGSLFFRDAPSTEQVVLFAGERRAIYRDVEVSTWRPRGGFVFHWIVLWGRLVIL